MIGTKQEKKTSAQAFSRSEHQNTVHTLCASVRSATPQNFPGTEETFNNALTQINPTKNYVVKIQKRTYMCWSGSILRPAEADSGSRTSWRVSELRNWTWNRDKSFSLWSATAAAARFRSVLGNSNTLNHREKKRRPTAPRKDSKLMRESALPAARMLMWVTSRSGERRLLHFLWLSVCPLARWLPTVSDHHAPPQGLSVLSFSLSLSPFPHVSPHHFPPVISPLFLSPAFMSLKR